MGLMRPAVAVCVSVQTARKWRYRFAQESLAGLLNRTSWLLKTRSTVFSRLAARILPLRHARMPPRRIATESTTSRGLM